MKEWKFETLICHFLSSRQKKLQISQNCDFFREPHDNFCKMKRLSLETCKKISANKKKENEVAWEIFFKKSSVTFRYVAPEPRFLRKK